MPRARRLSPGQGARGGGGLHALADILHGIFGGVEANPEFGTQGPTPSGTPLGGQPYKAKTIFDRAAASSMNADYMADESLAENDVSRALRTTEGMTPLLANRAREVGGANTEVEVDRARALRPQKKLDMQQENAGEIDKQRALELIKLLAGKGVSPTPQNEQAYNSQVSPSAINAAGQDYDTQAAKGSLEEILASIAQEQAGATRATDLNTAVANSQFGQTRAKALLEKAPQINSAEIASILQKPVIAEQNALVNRMTQVPQGGSVIDLLSPRKPIYKAPPSALDQRVIDDSGQGVTQPTNAPAQPQTYDESDIIIIGGKKYIRTRQ